MAETPRDAEAFLLQQRKEQLEAVRAQFARHGQPVHDLILQAIRQKHGLPLMLQRLGLRVPRTQEDQLDALAVFLSEHGSRHFLRLMAAAAPKAAPRAAAPPQPAPPVPDAAPLFDAQGRYIGPERRSGVERRAGGDRRNLIEAIRRNKRFGGDRRKVIRRQCDRAAAAALGLKPREYPPAKP